MSVTGVCRILPLLFAAPVVPPAARFGAAFQAWTVRLRGLHQ
jgi:hypothetical protein